MFVLVGDLLCYFYIATYKLFLILKRVITHNNTGQYFFFGPNPNCYW